MEEKEFMKFFQKRIRELMVSKQISAYHISVHIGRCNCFLNNILQGKSKPSITTFLDILNYLGVSPRDFFDPLMRKPEMIELNKYASKLPGGDILHLADEAKFLKGKNDEILQKGLNGRNPARDRIVIW